MNPIRRRVHRRTVRLGDEALALAIADRLDVYDCPVHERLLERKIRQLARWERWTKKQPPTASRPFTTGGWYHRRWLRDRLTEFAEVELELHALEYAEATRPAADSRTHPG